jgi:hypothetical protein
MAAQIQSTWRHVLLPVEAGEHDGHARRVVARLGGDVRLVAGQAGVVLGVGWTRALLAIHRPVHSSGRPPMGYLIARDGGPAGRRGVVSPPANRSLPPRGR